MVSVWLTEAVQEISMQLELLVLVAPIFAFLNTGASDVFRMHASFHRQPSRLHISVYAELRYPHLPLENSEDNKEAFA